VNLQPVVSRASQASFDLNKFVRGGYVNTYPSYSANFIGPLLPGTFGAGNNGLL